MNWVAYKQHSPHGWEFKMAALSYLVSGDDALGPSVVGGANKLLGTNPTHKGSAFLTESPLTALPLLLHLGLGSTWDSNIQT